MDTKPEYPPPTYNPLPPQYSGPTPLEPPVPGPAQLPPAGFSGAPPPGPPPQAYGQGAYHYAGAPPPQQPLMQSGPQPYPPPQYSTQPLAAAYHQSQPGVVVVNAQPHTTVVQQGFPQTKPSNNMGLAIFVTICCNIVLGGIAIAFSCMSDSDYQSGNVEEARSKGRISKTLSIVAIVTTCVVWTIVIVYILYIIFAVGLAFGRLLG